MCDLISKEHLHNRYRSAGAESIFKDAEKKRCRYTHSYESSVFISHGKEDIEELKLVVKLLNSLNSYIYADWLDNALLDHSSVYTLNRVKEKIRESEKFILIATEKTIKSEWIFWELGYGEAFKCTENLAILPIKEKDNTKWGSQCKLGVFPVIKTNRLGKSFDYFVEYRNDSIPLQDWLR